MPGINRFAPSSTGRAHPGTLLAALLAWLDARQLGNRLVLRVEDLDPERCSPGLTRGLLDDLAWFGLEWDALEIQSAQPARHAAALDELARQQVLYPCSLSRAELRAIGRIGPDGTLASDGRNRGRALPSAGWRACSEPLRVNLGGDLPDPVVRRRDGAVAYQLAVVVDDAAIGVTRVVRGRDLETSTPIQNALQRVLHLPIPTYHHHALLLEPGLEPGEDRKWSKFHGAVAVPELRPVYTAPQLCGFLAYCVGLGDGTPITPVALLSTFSWGAVSTDNVPIRWTGTELRREHTTPHAAATQLKKS